MFLLRLLPFACLFFGQTLGQIEAPSTVRYHCGTNPAKVKINNNCAAGDAKFCVRAFCKTKCNSGAYGVSAGTGFCDCYCL
ncbi:hypothetical protein VTL71DRAFT_1593 [Oculimacula yallundae]|uniref:Uncharacterized protein n=1 Tax=Oculimacula yallundae TaxID=86028 RepID=A0ABR4CB91_9HELO